MRKFKIILALILSTANIFLYALDNSIIDSLKQELNSASHDTIKLRILEEMIEAEPRDVYWSIYNKKMLALAEKLLANNPNAPTLKTAKKHVASALNNLGYLYNNLGDIPKTLDVLSKSIKLQEEIGDKKGMSTSYNNIGMIYRNQGDIPKALEFYNKSLKIAEEIGDKESMAYSLNNIGLVYNEKKDFSMALQYYNKSLKIRETIGDKQGIALSYNNIGVIYYEKSDYTKALEYYEKSLKLREEIIDKQGMAASNINIGMIYLAKMDIQNAEKYARKAYIIAKELGYPDNIERAAALLKKINNNQGDYKKAFEFYQEEIMMRESINNNENFKKTQKQQAKYEYEKKAIADSIAHIKVIEIKNIEVKKQRIIIGFVAMGLVLVLIIAIIIFRTLRITRKQKNVILTQRDEISVQNKILKQNKEQIEQIYSEISDSINYAKYIQQAVLPAGEYADKILGEHFIFFKPKNVVSGDFYWAKKVNENLIITVADCTGHGVPGAFMSMLGISFLNEIVRKKDELKASNILDQLRESVIDALKQTGSSASLATSEIKGIKDGMDLALVVINTETLESQYAGANNSLLIVHNTNELEEIKADKMPVAIHDSMQPFTNHLFQLEKGDILYLTTDGFQDQFGGPKHKKFLSKNMKELLLKISIHPMNIQKELLQKALDDWKGDAEQMDDITIMGIKIN